MKKEEGKAVDQLKARQEVGVIEARKR